MFAVRVVGWLIFPALALAQADDIVDRLRRVLTDSDRREDALNAVSKKDYAQVESILESAKHSNPAVRAELLSLDGAAQFLEGKVKLAAQSFQEAARLGPLRETDQFTMAMAFVRLGDDERARTILSRLAEQHPDRALYLYWVGRLDYDERRYQDAIEKLTRAAAVDATSPRIWNSLGLAFDMAGNSESALDALEKAVSLNRNQAHPSAWPAHDLGFLLLRLDRAGDAAAALRESLRYDPALPQAHYHLGRALEKSGDRAEAVEEYRKASAADTASTDASYSLAILLEKMQRKDESEKAFAEFRKRKQITPGATTGDTAYRLP